MQGIDIVFIKQLKEQILVSRYHAGKLVNTEMLKLYFVVGKSLTKKFEQEKWGTKVLETVSSQLQQELNGLRGFSVTNMRKMRVFYQAWNKSPLAKVLESKQSSILPTLSVKLEKELIDSFLSISFSKHYEIITRVKEPKHRWFYIKQTAVFFWSVRHLRTELKNKIHFQKELPNNFKQSLKPHLSNKAIQTFKDEYLLDFINIEDPDEEINERVLELSIIQNIKKFLMSLGNDFTFMGNQYRLNVAGDDYFIDLLFFHRGLRALVAFELKKGDFKPEYIGKMNFYLSALDDLVKQEHENPSIGIILCKEKNNKKVEYSFRDFNKPMGVSIFKTSEELPEKYKKQLPDAKVLKKLLD